MLFLVDAQLPPAEALRHAGCQAVHVTKDRDFPLRRVARNDGPAIVWVRIGNASNRKLIDLALRALPAITDAIKRGEVVIELVGRQ